MTWHYVLLSLPRGPVVFFFLSRVFPSCHSRLLFPPCSHLPTNAESCMRIPSSWAFFHITDTLTFVCGIIGNFIGSSNCCVWVTLLMAESPAISPELHDSFPLALPLPFFEHSLTRLFSIHPLGFMTFRSFFSSLSSYRPVYTDDTDGYSEMENLSDESHEQVSSGPVEKKARPAKRTHYRALATKAEKLYMIVAALQAIIIVAIAFSVFGLIQANIYSQGPKVRTVPVYLAIFIMAQVFSLLYVFDALRARNIVQLCLHLWFNVCMLTYSILQIPQTKDAMGDEPVNGCGRFTSCVDGPDSLYFLLQKLMIVAPIVFGVCTAVFAFLIRRLFLQFGWAVFYLVGASPQLKQMHRAYQTLISLLKLLLFFALSFCIAYLILVTSTSTHRAEFIITIVALPLAVLCMFACGWALRAENKPVMASCLVVMVLGLVYFIYKLASMWLPRTAYLYINTKITMAIFSIFSIIILIITFVFGCLCMSNFGKGLIEAHRNPENRTSLWALPETARFGEKARHDEEEQRPEHRLVID
ncbi:hypothetical protein BCR39DRAFT_519441 [Naematelia encephala]|uniref:Uncharacterized protein n=1 Tax=Naematelia encephala TaxID=71784 RepID=A0A1Y2BEV0_9TREE|nr:hypothetical protein BCR39DRAFT_519441 [Naematelia encephala]